MRRSLLVLIFISGLAGLYFFFGQKQDLQIEGKSTLSLTEVLSGVDEGFERAIEVRPFTFPEDHGPHDGFKTEWWYFTGNLETRAGRDFGFQFTLFRSALSPAPVKRESAWAASQIYMAHLALTDVASGRFYAFERFARGALGLAGAARDPLRFWLEDWYVEEAGPGQFAGLPLMHLEAFEEDIGAELVLDSVKPVILQGDRGLSRKSRNPGNASYYYSLTRLEAEGKIRLSGQEHEVTGWAWMDREWSTSVLEEDQVGWDWFALQLDNGEEIMFGRIRRSNGSADSFSGGCWINKEGETTPLAFEDVVVETRAYWQNHDGEKYPSLWRLSIPTRDTVLEIEPLLADQELRLSIHYWEGAVSAEGTIAGRGVQGKGYVELTGYADTPLPR